MVLENVGCSEGERTLTFWAKLATLYVEKDAHMVQRDIIGKEISNYRVTQRIANGAFGTAYLAKHRHLPRTVVIKILHGIHLDSEEEKEQFRQEAHILDMLQDPNISNVLHLLDFGIEDDVPYMIMEYAEQGSLRKRMQQHSSPLSLPEALKIIEQVGKGLQSAHDKRIVHRDLKPENILFNAQGEALLADFGIAIVLKTASVKRTNIVGTPAYMAPEQFRGEVCKENDQYALACIAYEMLTGHKLFEVQDIHAWSHHHLHEKPTPPRQHNPQIPACVERALLKALAKKRTERYPNVSAFVTALTAHNPPPKPRTSRRFPLLAGGALALIALLLLSLSIPQLINHLPFLPTAGDDGIRVTSVDGEDIGISDGRYVFDTNRDSKDAVALKIKASASLRNGDRDKALAKWNGAYEKDTSDAETLIYAENERVLASGKPYISIVLGVSLGVRVPDGFGRSDLQGAYIAQKECNENPQLSGGKKLRLLIARSGSDPKRSEDIAKQIVLAAQFDKTIVGVQGWTTSVTTLNAVKILADAHPLPIVAADTASDELTGKSPYFFRVGTPSQVSTPLETTYIEKQLKSQRLVILRDPGEPYSRDTSARLGQQFAQDGYKIASIEDFTIDKDAKDGKLAKLVQKALTTYKPDLFYIATNTVGDVIALLNAIPADPEYAGIKVFAGGAGYELVQNLDKVTGTGYTRMLLSSSAYPDEWSMLGQGKPVPPFFQHYSATYDPHDQHTNSPYMYRRANGGTMMDYDAVYAFLVASRNAIQQGKHNPTPEDIRNALSQISFQGITGAISFASDGNPISKVRFVLRVADGVHLHLAAYQGCFLVGSVCDGDIHILE